MTTTVPGTDTVTISVHNPADGRLVGAVPIDGPDAVAAKAHEWRVFQPQWEAIGPRGRKRWLIEYQNWLLDNSEHITEVVM